MKSVNFLIILVLFLTGCQTPKTTQFLNRATMEGFQTQHIDAPPFVLTTLSKMKSDHPLTIFIEGDGHAWSRIDVVSDDPTPRQPLALELALTSTASSVAYIARPCQYEGLSRSKACEPKYWTSHRYAPEVVSSLNQAVDRLKIQSLAPSIILVGYSGGGGLVTLMAAERRDVNALITIAGNLDTDTFNAYHHTTPMTGSINPITQAHLISNVPQWHWSGEKDSIVPPFIGQGFVKAIHAPSKAHHVILKNATHHNGWVAHWPIIEQQLN